MEIVSIFVFLLLFIVFVGDAIGYFGISKYFLGDSRVVPVGHIIAAKIHNVGVPHPCNHRIYYWHIYILYSNDFTSFNKIANTVVVDFLLNIFVSTFNNMDSHLKKYILAAGVVGLSYALFNYLTEEKHKILPVNFTRKILQ